MFQSTNGEKSSTPEMLDFLMGQTFSYFLNSVPYTWYVIKL